MAKQLKPLTIKEAKGVRRELDELASKMAVIGNVIGPAFGAAWCDKALKIHHTIQSLGVNVEDEAYRKRKVVEPLTVADPVKWEVAAIGVKGQTDIRIVEAVSLIDAIGQALIERGWGAGLSVRGRLWREGQGNLLAELQTDQKSRDLA